MLCFLLMSCSSNQAKNLGEVYMYKAVPKDAVMTSSRSAAVYALRGPGYPASENSNRIFDLFNDFGHASLNTLINEVDRLRSESVRELKLFELKGEENSTTAKSLNEIAIESETIYQKLIGVYDQKSDQEKAFERELVHSVSTLLYTQKFLRNLGEDIKGLYQDLYDNSDNWIAWDQHTEYLGNKYPFFIQIGGEPLPLDAIGYRKPSEEEIKESQGKWDKDNEGMLVYLKDDNTKIESPYDYFISKALPKTVDPNSSVNNNENEAGANQKKEYLGSRVYEGLEINLRSVIENALILKSGIEYKWEYLPELVRQESRSTSKTASLSGNNSIVKESLEETEVNYSEKIKYIESYRYKRKINELETLINSSHYQINHLLGDLAKVMAVISRQFSNDKIDIEVMARRFDTLVPRFPNRPLLPAIEPSDPPTRLTMILKRVFVKYLSGHEVLNSNEKDTSLLITFEVKDAESVSQGGALSPVVLERHFLPNHFVNVHDRIIYGPRIYNGDFFNVKISIVKMNGLNESAIGDGLDMAMEAAGKMAPGLTAVSPFVSTLFRGVLNSVSKDDMELEFQYLIPGPEGKGKADVDMLIAETGHYIILKRENPVRNGVKTGLSSRRYSDNDIIYNPEDGYLYYRKDMETPRNNFLPENLFKEQTYMVFVLTDEYVTDDNLGEALRNQLSKSLGAERSRQLIPDAQSTNMAISNYTQSLNNKTPEGVILDGASIRKKRINLEKKQDLLWGASSDFQKTMIVEALWANATSELKQALNKDINGWKKAQLTVNENGQYELDE